MTVQATAAAKAIKALKTDEFGVAEEASAVWSTVATEACELSLFPVPAAVLHVCDMLLAK